jgi:hypothetical protein
LAEFLFRQENIPRSTFFLLLLFENSTFLDSFTFSFFCPSFTIYILSSNLKNILVCPLIQSPPPQEGHILIYWAWKTPRIICEALQVRLFIDIDVLLHSYEVLKGTVSPDFLIFFIIYDIKSVLSVWTLMA